MDVNTDKIRELADLALEKKLAELIVQDGEKSVTIKLPQYPLTSLMNSGMNTNPGISVTGMPQGVVYAPVAPPPIAEIAAVSSHVPAATTAAAPAAAPASPPKGETITAPMVGTYYAAPSPDSPPFVAVGQSVSKGQVLCILEAMKMMNELESEVSGTVVQILVENGQPVEFGQPLMIIA